MFGREEYSRYYAISQGKKRFSGFFPFLRSKRAEGEPPLFCVILRFCGNRRKAGGISLTGTKLYDTIRINKQEIEARPVKSTAQHGQPGEDPQRDPPDRAEKGRAPKRGFAAGSFAGRGDKILPAVAAMRSAIDVPGSDPRRPEGLSRVQHAGERMAPPPVLLFD